MADHNQWTDVRAALNAWSRGGFFRGRALGDTADIQDVRPGVAYAIRVRTERESREVVNVELPFGGGSIDNSGSPPGPWDVQVDRPTDFGDSVARVPLPHTDQVKQCGRCLGGGSVPCTNCMGKGNTRCPFCNGTGRRMMRRSKTTSVPGRFQTVSMGGKFKTVSIPPSFRTDWVNEPVPCTCNGGVVRCGRCGGTGRLACSNCKGAGRLLVRDELVVTFKAGEQVDAVNTSGLPDDLVRVAGGATVFDRRVEGTDDGNSIADGCDEAIKPQLSALLNKPVDAAAGRVLFRRAQVGRVPVSVVTLRPASSKGPPLTAWVYGDRQSVYFPNGPKAWNRIAVVVIGVFFLVLILAGIVVSHLGSTTHYSGQPGRQMTPYVRR